MLHIWIYVGYDMAAKDEIADEFARVLQSQNIGN